MTRDHLSINRGVWDADAANWAAVGKRLWSVATPEWGNSGNPDDGLNLLPPDMADMDAIELGCGTGYVSGGPVRLQTFAAVHAPVFNHVNQDEISPAGIFSN